MQMFKDKLMKDYGTEGALWYCGINECDNIYTMQNLQALDKEKGVIWGRLHKESKSLVPICSNHGRFLLFMVDNPDSKQELLL